MHLLLTDRLACPRCGPEFGLILMAGDVRDRRVFEGHLGCFNCREEYPVDGGIADLRPPPRGRIDEASALPPDDPERALRLAALLGVREGPGHLLVMGEPAAQAERVAAIVEAIEVVAVHPGFEGTDEVGGVSRVRVGNVLPLQSYAMRGVALEGAFVTSHLEEGLRVLSPGARLVLMGAPNGTLEALEARGLELLLATDRALVAQR
ncbi:MAG: hypothetical protein EA351_01940 [Gemmatimonadales bacterium]|nr:MAG: hypothetical protein EA351_01940 [Gemmatimonadales bacterium]